MKTVFVANFLPDTNYTRDLSQGFIQIMKKNDELYLCGRKNEPVLDGKMPEVDLVWKKGVFPYISIIKYIYSKKAQVVHVQHEFKTYGGILSAILFPWFILALRLLRLKVVITSHGIVSRKQLSKDFLEGFGLSYNLLNLFLVKSFLTYSYKLIIYFANCTTVHSPFLREILTNEYKCSPKKVVFVEHGIREIKDISLLPKNPKIYKKYPKLKNKNIILVFGYFSPRKGFEFLLEGFSDLIKSEKVDNWIMVFAGDVNKEFLPYKLKIDKLIKNKKLDKYTLITGFIDAVEVDEFYRLAKISVIPAAYSFNTSGALAMTLAYRKPLMVSNVKPISEEIRLNKFGLLYDLGGKNSFENQFKKMISDKKTYSLIKSTLDKETPRRFWKNIALEHYKLYSKILKS